VHRPNNRGWRRERDQSIDKFTVLFGGRIIRKGHGCRPVIREQVVNEQSRAAVRKSRIGVVEPAAAGWCLSLPRVLPRSCQSWGEWDTRTGPPPPLESEARGVLWTVESGAGKLRPTEQIPLLACWPSRSNCENRRKVERMGSDRQLLREKGHKELVH
jgi:hypothetical protein